MARSRAGHGDRRGALDALDHLRAIAPVSGHDLAMLYASIGRPQMALASLTQSCRDHDVWLCLSLVQFGQDPIRSEPGFQELLSRIEPGPLLEKNER